MLDFLKCIFMPFSVLGELEEVQTEYMALYLLAKKHVPDHEIKELLTREQLSLTLDEVGEFIEHVESLTEE